MNPDILHRKLFYTGIWIFSLYHTSESIFSCFHLLPNSGGAWPSVLFTSEQQNKINRAFVIILLKLNFNPWANNYSDYVVYTKTITQKRVREKWPHFTYTSVNNCQIYQAKSVKYDYCCLIIISHL